MKKILTMVACAIYLSIHAQVIQLQGFNLGETDPDMRAISIGTVANDADIDARLHVNNFVCNAPTGGLNGFLFRTDGDSTVVNQWQMFSGLNNNSLLQRARFLTTPTGWTQNNTWQTGMYNNSVNHLHIESSRGDVVIDAGGSLEEDGGNPNRPDERMRISAHSFVDSAYSDEPQQYTRVSISSIPNFPVVEPLSLLHLGDPWNFEEGGHRNWMNYGMGVFRGNDDIWLGMKQREDVTDIDNADAVITWGDNGPGTPGYAADNFRIIYCGPYDIMADSGTADHLHGLEVFRATPAATTGIGDYSLLGPNPPGSASYIDAKLDIDGDLRIREVPEDDTLTRVLLIDSLDFNRVHYKEVELGALECDWNVVNNGLDVAMGYAPNPNENDACVPDNVGIGVLPASYNRLDIYKSTPASTTTQNGINLFTVGGTGPSNSINIRHSGLGSTVTGVNSLAGAGTNCAVATITGVRGESYGSSTFNYGTYGTATTGCSTCGSIAYGTYGQAFATNNTPGCQQAWAAYFNGRGFLLNGPWTYSDESLKTNVNTLSGSLDKLNQLKMYSFNFNQDTDIGISVPSEIQYGPLAQELQELFPEMVTMATQPPQNDTEGNQISSGGEFLAINPTQLIPHLITAVQELSSKVVNLEAQIAAADEAKTLHQNPDYQQNVKLGNALVPILYQNTPNPHKGACTVKYIVPEINSNCEIQFFDMYGNAIKTVTVTQTGMGQLNIDANDLAAGSYSYALVVDGVVVASKVMLKE